MFRPSLIIIATQISGEEIILHYHEKCVIQTYVHSSYGRCISYNDSKTVFYLKGYFQNWMSAFATVEMQVNDNQNFLTVLNLRILNDPIAY